MKRISTAFVKAVAVSVWILVNSGFLAMAADPVPMPPSGPAEENTDISVAEDTEITNQLLENKNAQAISQEQSGTLSSDDQIPIGVVINGIQREEGMTVYLPSAETTDNVLIPLGVISELLSYAIVTNAGDRQAEGFFEKEENTFQLDLNAQEVMVAGTKRKLKPGEAQIQDGDIFIRMDSLEEWFGFDITFDLSNLQLVLNTGSDLPFQERMKRLLNAKKNQRTYTYDAINPKEAALAPYRNFSLPSLYITNSLGFQRVSNDRAFLGYATLQGYQDIAKFEADYTFAGRYLGVDGQQITGSRMTLRKRDPQNKLFGPMKAGRVSIGDVYFPSVPLFGNGGSGAGLEISSDSSLGTRYANNSDDFILEGDAPIGYDAELYRNGIFVAFQQIGPNGQYRFENIELPSGYNTFEIILYGPQGQKTTIKRDVTRGARQLRKGEVQYDLAAGMPKADLLPLADNSRDARDPGVSGQLFYGFTNFFTMGLSAFNGPQEKPKGNESNFTSFSSPLTDDDEDDLVNTSGAAVSTAVSFLGMNVKAQAMGADKGRSAYDTSIDTRFLGNNVGVAYTTYRNFLEDEQELKDRAEFYIGRSFGGFNTSFRLQQRTYLDRADQTSIQNISSFNFRGFRINNDLIRTIASDNYDDFEGELAALATLADIRMRGAVVYDLDDEAQNKIRRISFSGQKRLTGRSSLRFEGVHEFDTEIDSLNLRYSRDYDRFGLDLDSYVTSENDVIFTVGMRVALQPDKNNDYRLADPRSGGQASLGMRAFIDKNGNNIFDDGDAPLEGIEFRASTGTDRQPTGKDGITYMTNLGEAPLRLKVVTESIPDIYLAPKFDHRDLIPRKGATPMIDFPFVKMNEIAGYLLHLKQGVEGAIVRLISIADGKEIEKTETDSDGYFIFPAVKGGNYKVSFGLPQQEFLSLNVNLDANIEDPKEIMVEADEKLVSAIQDAAPKPKRNIGNAAQSNIDRMNAPAGDLPNIDDPLEEEDLKPLEEKDIEGIITQ